MGRALVEARLAACAQISKIESIYVWKGTIERGDEYRLLLKATEARYDAVERAIRELRSYDLPAIHAFAFAHASVAYSTWIEENVA